MVIDNTANQSRPLQLSNQRSGEPHSPTLPSVCPREFSASPTAPAFLQKREVINTLRYLRLPQLHNNPLQESSEFRSRRMGPVRGSEVIAQSTPTSQWRTAGGHFAACVTPLLPPAEPSPPHERYLTDLSSCPGYLPGHPAWHAPHRLP